MAERSEKRVPRGPIASVFEALLESAEEQFAFLDGEFRFVWVNRAYAAGAGYSREALLGRGHFELFPNAENEALFRKVRDTGEPAELRARPFVYAHAPERGVTYWDGTLRWLNAESDRPEGLVLSLRNVTEEVESRAGRRRAEEILQQVIDNTPALVYALDAEGRFLFANKALEEVLGVSNESVVGHGRQEFLPGEVAAAHRAQDLRVLEAGAPISVEEENLQPDGTHWYRTVKFPLPGLDGLGGTVEGVSTDITERRRSESVMAARVRLLEFARDHPLDETLQQALDEASGLTESPVGFYHVVEADGSSLSLQAWSTRTLAEFCTAEGKGLHYALAEAGIWAEAARERRPIVHNDYASLPGRRGLPPGHAPVVRELVVPILREGRVVAILGVGNKPRDYTPDDVEVLRFFADVVWEVGKRKLLEEALDNNRRLLAEIEAIGEVGGWEFDIDTRRLTWSDGVFRIHEIDRPCDLTVEEGIDFYTPASRLMIERAVQQAIKGGEPFDLELEILTAKGNLRSVHAVGNPELERRRVFGFFQDITRRKKTEAVLAEREEDYRGISEDFRAVLDAVPDCLTLQDRSLRILWANSAAERNLRTPLEGGGGGKACYASWFNRNKPCEPCLVHESFATGRPATATLTSPGGKVWEIRSIPVLDELQQATRVVTARRDITEHRTLEAQLRQAQKMEAVGRLAGGVAHDFNNLLTVINGLAELAASEISPLDPLRERMEGILEAGGRAASLTRQLLAFARQQVACPRRLDLNEAVGGMQKMLRRLIGEDIDLVWKPGAEPGLVYLDPSHVDQVLANLVVNARDAIVGTGQVILEVSSTELDEGFVSRHPGSSPGEHVVLTVSDSGAGIDRESLPHIFDPFFTTKEQGKGTGLGLATVYGIVKQARGSIYAYSEPGQGAVFRIYLPRWQGGDGAAVVKGAESKTLAGSETVLLVEDEKPILQLGRTILEKHGYRVLAALTPGDALLAAEREPGEIHLLATDVVMPGMKGRELCERLRLLRPNLKCLYLSGYTADAITQRGVLAEGVRFLQKPYSLKGLAECVRAVLDAQQGECP